MTNILSALDQHKFMWLFTLFGLAVFGPIGALGGLPGFAIDASLSWWNSGRAGETRESDEKIIRSFNDFQDPYGSLKESSQIGDTTTLDFALWTRPYGRWHGRWLIMFLLVVSAYTITIYTLSLVDFGPATAWIAVTQPFVERLAAKVPAINHYEKILDAFGYHQKIGAVRHIYSAFFVFMILEAACCIHIFRNSSIQMRTQYYKKNKRSQFGSVLLSLALVLILVPILVLCFYVLFTGLGIEKFLKRNQIEGTFLYHSVILSSFTVYISFFCTSMIVFLSKLFGDYVMRSGDAPNP